MMSVGGIDMVPLGVAREGGLWLVGLSTGYGSMEMLCGEGDRPDVRVLVLAEKFLDDAADHLGAIRRASFGIPILWRPIRLAVNNAGRLGVQFRHRLSGRQELVFADERSSFTTRLSDVSPVPGDLERLLG